MLINKLIKSIKVYFAISFVMIFFASYWRNLLIGLTPSFENAAERGLLVFGLIDILVVTTFASLLLAIVSSFLDVFVLRKLFENKSLRKAFTLSLLMEILTISMILIISFRFVDYFVLKRDFDSIIYISNIPDVGMVFILTGIIIFISRFILEIDQKMGKGNLKRFVTGKFHKPRNERRIFMFLDLKSSTTIAEKIGHYDFSLLLQDCFKDLSIVDKYHAEVYQYVGDEVVLIWDPVKGLLNENYLKAFFAFKKVLKEREKYYIDKYGLFPVFKAGANIGDCTVTEVGELKREISYHGDTINTAARIEGLCGQYNAELLISEFLKEATHSFSDFLIEERGCIGLKGKKNKVLLYELNEKVS